MFNSLSTSPTALSAASVSSHIIPPPTIFSLGPVSLTLLFGLFWDTGALGGWWWGVEAAVWSAVGEVGRGGGERRGGRKRVEVEGRGGGGEEGREGKGRRGKRGDLRRWEEEGGGSIQLQAAGGDMTRRRGNARAIFPPLHNTEREREREREIMGERTHSCSFSTHRKQETKETDTIVGLLGGKSFGN